MSEEKIEVDEPKNVPEPEIDEHQMNLLLSQMQSEQNLPFALIGGFIASIIGATIWALITAATEYQIGWMAIGIGFMAGISVKQFGKGVDKVFGIVGSIFAILGCILGNFFTILIFVSREEASSFFTLLFQIEFTTVVNIMIETFHPMDVLFYGLAVYAGYRYAFRKITDEELSKVLKQ